MAPVDDIEQALIETDKLTTKEEIHFLKLRVQNICCGKEANLIKDNLSNVDGIVSVNVNVIGRTAFISHNASVISAMQIVERLDSLHLGISLIEKGQTIENTDARKSLILLLKISNVVVMTLLFIGVIIARTQKSSLEKWLTIPIVVLGGSVMLWKTILDLRRRVFISVNLLMMVAVVGTIVLEEWINSVVILYVFAIAELIENACRYKVEKDISNLMLSAPETAVLAETNETVSVENIEIGTVILICAGEKIPLDGEVLKGKAAVDESSITGESIPSAKKVGSIVYSGTIIQGGYLKVKTTCDYNSSTVSRISQLVEEAQSKSSNTEQILNKFAKFYTPSILIISFLIFIIPFILYKVKDDFDRDDLHSWSIRALIILVVACPCSLIMATPIPMVCGITNAVKFGALIRGGAYLEKLSKVNTIVFDKTGTLTEGRFQVVHEHCTDDSERDRAIELAAALETKSSHPLAASVVNHYSGCITDKINEHGTQVGLPDVTKFKNESGMGLSGIIAEHDVIVGNYELMTTHNVLVDDISNVYFNDWSRDGCTVIFVAVDQQLKLVLALADKCRSSSSKAIGLIQKKKIHCVMLTGDTEGPAQMIKKQVGLSECISAMKPHEKYEWIIQQRKNAKNAVIAMVGDGVNDCPSLAAADVGIAIGPSATALAVQSADISLMTDNLERIAHLISLSKFCRRVVFQNISISVGIKIIFVIVAFSWNTSLWLAVLSDVVGLLLVTLNGIRPLYWKVKIQPHKVTYGTVQSSDGDNEIVL